MSPSLHTTFQKAVSSLLDFIYPPFCISCKRNLEDGARHVCGACWSSMRQVTRTLPLFQETSVKLLASGAVDELVSLYVFEKKGTFQHIVHALKYQGTRSLGVALGTRLGDRMREWGVSADLLLPIPLHRQKQRERGYNQAELIARGIQKSMRIPVRADLVLRTRFTQTQTTLSIEKRKKNVEAAFEVPRSRVPELKDRRCILVDDIITTGSTVESCARALREAGAARITAASVALAE